MTDRPILFSAPMVRAILDGSKTVTRREVTVRGAITAMSYAPLHPEHGLRVTARIGKRRVVVPIADALEACPYGVPGDRLWVKETWGLFDRESFGGEKGYAVAWRATHPTPEDGCEWIDGPPVCDTPTTGTLIPSERWRPSIHMPRWASRITLEVTSVRVERLQDITEEDAKAEGCVDTRRAVVASDLIPSGRAFLIGGDLADGALTIGQDARGNFRSLWSSINGAESWEKSPWVWVIGFRRIEVPRVG